MEEMISICGLNCSRCPTFIATQEDDDKKRKKVSEQWSELLGMELKPEDISCDGCRSTTGRLFGHCSNCQVRSCGLERDIANCAHCSEYSCEKLDNFLKNFPNPEARETLDRIRKTV